MKKLLLLCCLCCSLSSAYCQSAAIQQLLLNMEKLRQFKQILADMKKGYLILSKGYGTVKDLSEGNFHLHQVFLQSLAEVSPRVKKYHRVAEITQGQVELLKQIHSALGALKKQDIFHPQETLYLQQVFKRVLQQSLENVSDLMQLLQSGTLQMSDEERLSEIDHLYDKMKDQSSFTQHFIAEIQFQIQHRKSDLADIQALQNYYSIH